MIENDHISPISDSSVVNAGFKPNMSLLVVCGEMSSDEHTAPVIASLLRNNPGLKVYGMGGEQLQEAGMELVVDARETASVMGFTEVFGKLNVLIGAFNHLLEEVDRRETRVALLVDFPDFNLRLAKKLKARGITVLYFISPQLWAWRKGRVTQVKKYVDRMLPIFPFEQEFYRKEGVDAKYVGHPFLDREPSAISKEEFFRIHKIPDGKRLVALLPGSRHAEITKIFPTMLGAAEEFSKRTPDSPVHYLIPMAGSVEHLFENYPPPSTAFTYIRGHAREILKFSDAAVVASGTATVEAALAGLPFCIVYRVSPLTYIIGKLLIRGVSSVGMPNLILGRPLVNEYLQKELTVAALAEEMRALLYDTVRRKELLEGLKEMKKKLEVHSNTLALASGEEDQQVPLDSSTVAQRVGSEIQLFINKQYNYYPKSEDASFTVVADAMTNDMEPA